MDKLTYSVSELAKVLGIGRNVAYELVSREDFPSVRVGQRRVVIPVDGLKVWLAKQADVQLSDSV